jgi:hypothetical protein
MFVVALGLCLVYATLVLDAMRRNPMMGIFAFVSNVLEGAALFFWFKPSSDAWFKDRTTTV